MSELLFGTGGSPHSSENRSVLAGVGRIKELGLDCMEVEFVHGVRIKREVAEEAGRAAEELGVTLTCHGPYYINLNSLDSSSEFNVKLGKIGFSFWRRVLFNNVILRNFKSRKEFISVISNIFDFSKIGCSW